MSLGHTARTLVAAAALAGTATILTACVSRTYVQERPSEPAPVIVAPAQPAPPPTVTVRPTY